MQNEEVKILEIEKNASGNAKEAIEQYKNILKKYKNKVKNLENELKDINHENYMDKEILLDDVRSITK